jgi:hypothetical protein
MLNGCFTYYKDCESWQKFVDVQLAPVAMLHPIIKPWSFRGRALDFIGQIYPASSKDHRFVLVAMDYFPKWTEVVPLKNMTQRINPLYSIADHTQIRHSSSMSHQVREFAESLKIKLLSSSPYYAQANGQIESSNRTLTKLIKKKIEEHPKRWHEVLSEALWAHHISKQSATKVTPFQLVYGQEAILLLEVNLDAL